MTTTDLRMWDSLGEEANLAVSKPYSSSITPSTKANTKAKTLWCESQWTNLSLQAKTLGLETQPYFDPKTMLLSKEVNGRLWRQIGRLYDFLGAEKAALATPVMVEGGDVEWHSFMNDDQGQVAEIYDK